MAKRRVLISSLPVPLPGWPAELAGLRIAHVSDFHFHRWNRVMQEAQERLRDLEYDLLIATGDFGDFRSRWRRAAECAGRFFAPLASRGTIYAVLGNHDVPDLAERHDVPLRFLRNEWTMVPIRGRRLALAGVEQVEPRGGSLGRALDGIPPGVPVVLLAHYPSTAFHVPPDRVSLVLSGHTHGGQIRFPGLGCVWPNDRVPRRMARGLHRLPNTVVHVSVGIGVSLPLRVRINCPPEISVLQLLPDSGSVGFLPVGCVAAPGQLKPIP